ncbi:MAG: MBL fold metallo-hydrolase [Muribaculaceae bacterium]|nr:MBL fold metallo-hydrolase [Muribaculaceae bacterium]
MNSRQRKIKFNNIEAQQLEIPFDDFIISDAPENLETTLSEESRKVSKREKFRRDAFRSATRMDEPSEAESRDNRLYYVSLGSGSSGNACYVGTRDAGVLIDAGLRSDHIEISLRAHGIDIRSVKGLLLTHDHTDHVKFAYNFLRNNKHVRLFCSNRVLNGLLRRHSISRRIKDYHTPVFKEIPFKVGDFVVTAFDVPHDGSDNMGFSIEFDSRRFVLATDLGSITERGHFYMSQADYLVIEANYDLNMLLKGPYPEYLKTRIRNGHGHLDNKETAAFLAEIASPRLKYIFLCHLSQENNTPQLAVSAVREALEKAGWSVGDCSNSLQTRHADIQLMALPRTQSSPLFVFR